MDSLVGRQMGVSHNLPVRLTSFVGREREVAAGDRTMAWTPSSPVIHPEALVDRRDPLVMCTVDGGQVTCVRDET